MGAPPHPGGAGARGGGFFIKMSRANHLNHWTRDQEAELGRQDFVAADEQHRGTRHQDVRAQHEGQSNQDHCTGDHWMAADICSGARSMSNGMEAVACSIALNWGNCERGCQLWENL